MAREQRIDPGKLVPAAKPVSTFLNFQKANIPNAAQPQKLNAPPGINVVQRGNVSNVQGYNQLAQLSEAVGKLIPVVDTAAKIHQSQQYEKAANAMYKAVNNINKEELFKSIDHARQGKELERNNKAAAIIWDEMNMHYKAVMNNQGSTIAASFVPDLFNYYYNTTPGIETWDQGDKRILKAKADVVNVLKNITGLDEYDHGFIDKINPVITREWEKFSNKQFTARRKTERERIKLQTATGFYDLLLNLEGSVSRDELNKIVGVFWKDVRLHAGLQEDTGPAIRAATKLGIRRLKIAALNGDARAARLLGVVSTLPAGQGEKAEGVPYTIGEDIGPDLEIDIHDLEKTRFKADKDAQQNAEIDIRNLYENDLFDAILEGREEDSLKIQEQIMNDNTTVLTKPNKSNFINEIIQGAKQLKEDQIITGPIDTFILQSEGLIGSDFDFKTFNKKANEFLNQMPIGPTRKRYRTRINEIRTNKASEVKQSYEPDQYKKLMSLIMQVTGEKQYGKKGLRIAMDEAGLPEDILKFIAQADGDKYEGLLRYQVELDSLVQTKIKDKLKDKGQGSNITKGELSLMFKEARKEIEEDEELMKQLLPNSIGRYSDDDINKSGIIEEESGIQDINQSKENVQDVKVNIKDGRFVEDTNIAQEDLENIENQPIYHPKAILRLINSGEGIVKDIKYPVAFRKAAKDIGISPEKLLLIHVNHYKDKPFANTWLDYFQKKELEKSSNQSQGILEGVNSGIYGFSNLAYSSRLLENILMGA
tara:strand:+ start:1 stop:2295 length:2295 start_codon:yes stop_codon:yes gene_type:complete